MLRLYFLDRLETGFLRRSLVEPDVLGYVLHVPFVLLNATPVLLLGALLFLSRHWGTSEMLT